MWEEQRKGDKLHILKLDVIGAWFYSHDSFVGGFLTFEKAEELLTRLDTVQREYWISKHGRKK